MKPCNDNRFWSRALVAVAAALGLAACGGGAGGGNEAMDGGSATVNFSMQLEGARNTASATKAMEAGEESEEDEDAPLSHDDAGTVIALSEVRVHVREVSFQLPEGLRCEDVQFTFVDPVRCDHDDDEAEEVESGDDALEEEGDDVSGEDDGFDDDGEGEDKVVVEGPFVADLIAGTSTPSLTTFLIPSGLYTRIEVKIEESKAEDGLLAADDPLLGNSLYVRGTFEYQGAPHELRILLKFNEEVRFESEAGMEVLETAANDIVLSLDENAWFRGVNLTACLDSGGLTLEPDGSLVIDEESGEDECGDIENIIKDNIEASGSSFRDDEDDDNDGIEDGEDEDDDNDGFDDDEESDEGEDDL